jgi:tetratricopeptide (TPR) repeat protein
LDLQPTNTVSHARYAWFLSDMGRHEEAIAELRRAQALDPQSIVIVNNLGRSLYLARRYDEAIVELRRAIEMAPDRLFNHVFLGMAYDAKQMCPEALNEFHIAQSLLASMDESGTVHAYATCGRTEDARKAVALLAGPRTESVQDWMYIGGVYAALGDKERAFEWLDKAVKNRDIFLTEVKVHPYMDPLRSDVRYARLLDSMKFPP